MYYLYLAYSIFKDSKIRKHFQNLWKRPDRKSTHVTKDTNREIKNVEIVEEQIDESGFADGESAKQHWSQSRQRRCQSHWHSFLFWLICRFSLIIC